MTIEEPSGLLALQDDDLFEEIKDRKAKVKALPTYTPNILEPNVISTSTPSCFAAFHY
jgi:hypothetical protein